GKSSSGPARTAGAHPQPRARVRSLPRHARLSVVIVEQVASVSLAVLLQIGADVVGQRDTLVVKRGGEGAEVGGADVRGGGGGRDAPPPTPPAGGLRGGLFTPPPSFGTHGGKAPERPPPRAGPAHGDDS